MAHILDTVPDAGKPHHLRIAAKANFLGGVNELLDAGCPPNLSPGVEEPSALMWAAFHNNSRMVDVLLKAGADVTQEFRERRAKDFATVENIVLRLS